MRLAFLDGKAEFFKIVCSETYEACTTDWCNRHIRMAKRLLKHLHAMPEARFFVLIGAMHLLSPANVLELLDIGGVATARVEV